MEQPGILPPFSDHRRTFVVEPSPLPAYLGVAYALGGGGVSTAIADIERDIAHSTFAPGYVLFDTLLAYGMLDRRFFALFFDGAGFPQLTAFEPVMPATVVFETRLASIWRIGANSTWKRSAPKLPVSCVQAGSSS